MPHLKVLRHVQLNCKTRPDFSCSVRINPDLSRRFFFKYLNSHHMCERCGGATGLCQPARLRSHWPMWRNGSIC